MTIGFISDTTINYDADDNNEVSYEISGYIKPRYVIADVNEVIMEIAEDTFEFDFFNIFVFSKIPNSVFWIFNHF